jgi:hypothetical protein
LWTFGEGVTSKATPTLSEATNVSASAVSQGNNNGMTLLLSMTSASGGYVGASSNYNAAAAARVGALNTCSNGSAYFEFTLTPDAGWGVGLTDLSFGTRSTPSGPQAFCLRSSQNNYASDLAVGTLGNDSSWDFKNVAPAFFSSVPGSAVTFRIYGFNGTGNAAANTANWRIDDLAVEAVATVPGMPSPPVIDPVVAQSVRVGQTLSFALSITPTDGDPVTATNCMADAGVTGAWHLADGMFSYTPAIADVGERAFAFTATDKDGARGPMTVAVTVRRAQVPAIRMTAASGRYLQDFNTLATNGTTAVWDNAAEPLEAWYAYAGLVPVSGYGVAKGSETAGSVYAYGTEGGAERSLGSVVSTTTGEIRYGVAFTNECGETVTNLTVSYTGEQWRCASNDIQSLTFGYCVTNAVLPLPQAAGRYCLALRFDAPHTTDMKAGAVDGAGAVLTASLPMSVPPGGVLILFWTDVNDAGSDHGLAIDDLAVTWSAGKPVPREGIAIGRAGAKENFNDLGSVPGAWLPLFWRIETRDDLPRVTGGYAGASEWTAHAISAVNFTTAGSYNFSSHAAGDQAVGGLSSASEAKSVTLYAKYCNATGIPLRRWTVRYGVEKYRNGQTGCAVRLLASTDGEAWTPVGEPTAFAADTDNNGYTADARPGMTVTAEQQVAFGLPVENNGVFYLAWQYGATEGGNTGNPQALAIDDVQVLPKFSGQCVFLLK